MSIWYYVYNYAKSLQCSPGGHNVHKLQFDKTPQEDKPWDLH